MRTFIFIVAALTLVLSTTLVFADGLPPTPSNTSEWRFIRIDAGKIVSSDKVQSAPLLVFYNYASNGLPAGAEAIPNLNVRVLGVDLSSDVVFKEPGVFSVNVTPQKLGIQGGELPDGSYWANATATEGQSVFKAFDPNAFTVVKKRTPVPETHFVAIALALFAAVFLMRRKAGK
ncbi:MAG TPA: hypothetical protein VI875_02025 [Candidatus Norongarragalinales archaeon]|nr:hypothetical protein [Candidatus Norongarragalinales archaeon]